MDPVRYCGHCGTPTNGAARYCGYCGARLGTPVPTTAGGSATGGAIPAGSTAGGGAAPVGGAIRPVQPVAPPLVPPHAAGAPVTGAVPVLPAGVAPAGALSATVVGGGRYVIDRPLGRGGMSAVYAARDLHVSGRLVAVKEMVDQFADPQERLEAERDFAREADLLSALRHPAIPAIIDRFSENSRHLLVMEYIAGDNLEHLLEVHGPYDEEQVRAWALELCSVLSYLHNQHPPVVFRDLKPGNIIVQPDGRIRLIDFGIARLFKPQQKADTTALGTSGYASPEHYTGQTDARSDIYSLGATMHHLLTGRDPSKFPPFQFPPVRELNPAVSNDLASIIERAVRSDRAKRFATVEEMQTALSRKRKRSKGTQATATATQPMVQPAATQPAPALPAPPANGHVPAAQPAQPSPLPSPLVPALPRGPVAVPAPAAVAPAAPLTPPARQILVLEAFAPDRRIDYKAAATWVATLTGGDATRLQSVLQRGLPVTLPLLPGTNVSIGLQALASAGVRARVVTPGTVPVMLNREMQRQLDTAHQIVVRDVLVGPARTCHCRSCGYIWKTNKAPGEPVPQRCPNCHSSEWGRWRIFKCAWCGHEWDTGNVHERHSGRLFPHCPCCGLPNWESGRPVRTSWLDRLLAAFGTA